MRASEKCSGAPALLSTERAMASNNARDPRTRMTAGIVAILLFSFNFGISVTHVVDDPSPSQWEMMSMVATATGLSILLLYRDPRDLTVGPLSTPSYLTAI